MNSICAFVQVLLSILAISIMCSHSLWNGMCNHSDMCSCYSCDFNNAFMQFHQCNSYGFTCAILAIPCPYLVISIFCKRYQKNMEHWLSSARKQLLKCNTTVIVSWQIIHFLCVPWTPYRAIISSVHHLLKSMRYGKYLAIWSKKDFIIIL